MQKSLLITQTEHPPLAQKNEPVILVSTRTNRHLPTHTHFVLVAEISLSVKSAGLLENVYFPVLSI